MDGAAGGRLDQSTCVSTGVDGTTPDLTVDL